MSCDLHDRAVVITVKQGVDFVFHNRGKHVLVTVMCLHLDCKPVVIFLPPVPKGLQ